MKDIVELKLPDISKQAEGTVVTHWYAQEKETLVKGQDLVEVATDKATFDVISPYDGVLMKIKKGIGHSVGRNEVIAEIKKKED